MKKIYSGHNYELGFKFKKNYIFKIFNLVLWRFFQIQDIQNLLNDP